jgi:tryptophanyl-tRNA synthetase
MLNEFLDPIREKRNKFAKKSGLIENILEQGRIKTQKKASETLALVKQAMRMEYKF